MIPGRRRRREPDRLEPVPEDLPSNPLRIFQTFERHGVDYVTIGGVAVQAHGHTRTTKDVDILAAPGRDNLRRLGAALAELDARLKGVDAHLLRIEPTDPEHLERGANFTLATEAGGLDVWTDAAELRGSPPWPEIRGRALETRVAGVIVRVVSLDDLVRLKRAAGREIDLRDIAALTAEL